jgi:glycosyltransferase involved in cell wall biosynthesis
MKGVTRLMQHLADATRLRDALPEGDVHYSYWCGAGAAALAMRKERGSPVRAVSRAHGGDLYREQWSPPYIPAQARVVTGLDHVFPVTRDGAHLLTGIAPTAHVEVARLGVEMPAEVARPSQDGVVRVLTCSSVVPVKRLDRMVAALASVRSRVEWTHVGGGPGLPALQESAARLPASVTARFTGQLSREDALRRYSSAPVDLFVNTSDSEGFPVALAEAMARGIPAIAPRIGGIAELLDDTCGRVLPAKPDPAAIATAIDELGALASARRAAARARIAESMNAEVNFRAFAERHRKLA